MQAQESRRAQVKKESQKLTKIYEAPFNFYLRDKSKVIKIEPESNIDSINKFKAKPIPAFCQLNDVWSNMKERKELERKEKIACLAQEKLLQAALPPRMAKHEQQKKEQDFANKLNQNIIEERKDTNNFRAKDVPNFDKLHQKLERELELKKSNKRTTQPQPFVFNEPKRTASRDYFDNDNQQKKPTRDESKRDPLEEAKRIFSTKPKVEAQTTKKTIALSEQRKKEREEIQKRLDQQVKEEQERKIRKQKL